MILIFNEILRLWKVKFGFQLSNNLSIYINAKLKLLFFSENRRGNFSFIIANEFPRK